MFIRANLLLIISFSGPLFSSLVICISSMKEPFLYTQAGYLTQCLIVAVGAKVCPDDIIVYELTILVQFTIYILFIVNLTPPKYSIIGYFITILTYLWAKYVEIDSQDSTLFIAYKSTIIAGIFGAHCYLNFVNEQ